MILPCKIDVLVKSEFTLSVSSTFASQQVRVNIDPTWPLDLLLIVLKVTAGATAPTTIAADGLLNFLKRINLSVNDGTARTVVDCSGAGLLDYARNVFGSLDSDTLYQYCHLPTASSGTPKTAFANNEVCRIVYPVFLAHPQLVDPLRSLTLLPTHTHKGDPVLTLDFASYAELNLNQSIANASFEIVKVAREMPEEVHNQIMARGGYIGYDLLENETAFASDNTDLHVEISNPGKYTGLSMRGYTDTQLRGDVTKSAADSWRIDQGGVVSRRFKWLQMQQLNELSMPVSPVPTANPYRSPGHCFLDFLSDVMGTDVAELGSLLDTERYGPQVKTYLIGSVTGGTPNKLKLMGHRLYGDVNRFKIVKSA